MKDDNDNFFNVHYLVYSTHEDIKKGIEVSYKLRSMGYSTSLIEGKSFKVVDKKKNRSLKAEEITDLLGE